MNDSIPTNTNESELRAVAMLQAGEIIKFPCRWKHRDVPASKAGVCVGANATHKTANRKGFRVQSRCRTLYDANGISQRWVYVRRLSEREEAAKNRRQREMLNAKMRDGFSTPTNMVSSMLERETEVQGSAGIGGSQPPETT